MLGRGEDDGNRWEVGVGVGDASAGERGQEVVEARERDVMTRAGWEWSRVGRMRNEGKLIFRLVIR